MKNGVVQIDGKEYRWQIHRQPRWTSDQVLLGLAVLVRPPDERKRELILEFAIDPDRHGDMPQHQRFRLSNRQIIRSINDALRSGWNPESRGKRFVFEAGPISQD